MELRVQSKFLTPNPYSRPGTRLKPVKGVVIHWVANPGSTALNNRNFFERRKDGKSGYGSAHYIVCLDGSIVQCLPETEMAYHVGSTTYTSAALTRLSRYPNDCTIGIECCHTDWDGRMTAETWRATVKLAAQLLKRYGLTENDLWLHKEVVGWKDCHRWFVNNPADWTRFKREVAEEMKGGSAKPPEDKKAEVVYLMSKYFKDIPKELEWCKDHADSLYEKGVLKGDGQGHLKPTDPLSRAEAAVLIDRAIDYVMKELTRK
ncbi:N-acetylmuramoyl-L-alanine amidase [Brevibacillus sp. WF146]|uniref:N-acetylmuramoyl-L-alanine amidase n=1 Tax=Brevibacillus sp. WF146 TaxID=319501 RepID=UPI0007ECB024|nr:N-acetylmuramoyl-L-alanine amidase [Brevibacillus sp. WF146]UYZ12128.1 N-acetylmuramoyl-L-alanine amidase [Brevibacillus sp. WF146]UYZ13415.1 N-acetylmuramoyl-L-alanine amidase [Brevibacillus sp. WF146]